MRRRLTIPLFLLLVVPGLLAYRLATPAPDRSLVGTVRDESDPVAGAVVRVKGHPASTRTDVNGRFNLFLGSLAAGRVTIAREGYFIAGNDPANGSAIQLERLPVEDFDEYRWVDPYPDPAGRHNCANCHGVIFREWQQSGHARSATGRRFLDLYGSESAGSRWNLLAEHPDGAGVCSSCHAPTVEGSDPAFFDLRQVQGVGSRGVHCDYCHKVADVNRDGQLGLTHGRFGLKLLRPAVGQLFFGPLDDVDRGEDAYSPLYRQSRYCASCHEGTVFGVHVYSTYTEWLASPARLEGKQCQTCHMAPTGELSNIAPGRGGIQRDPQSLGSHRMFAGSREEMLRQALKLSIKLNGARAEVEVRADGVGHRLPTGFVDRNLILVVEASSQGRLVKLRSGPVLPASVGKELARLPGQLYAKQLRDFQGRSPTPFWTAQPESIDSRLFPGRLERSVYIFAEQLDTVRARLLYRRFWAETTATKGWPDETVTVAEMTAVLR